MGYSSQPGVTIFRSQATRGITAPDIATKGVAVRLTSGALAGSRDLLVPDPEIGGGRDISDALAGAISFAGDYNFYLRFAGIGTFLKAALGTVDTVAGTTGFWTHTITPSDASNLPLLSIYEMISDGLERIQYTDCVVNTFHLESDANGYVTGTVNIVGAKQVQGVTDIDPADLYDVSTMTVGTNVVFQHGGVNIKPKSFSLDINNNIETDDFRLGSFFLEDLTAKRREVTLTATVRHEDGALIKQSLLGSPVATQAIGTTTKDPVDIMINTYENIPGSTPATKFSLNLQFPDVVLQPAAYGPSGDDILQTDFTMQAVRVTPTDKIVTAVLINGENEIA